MDHPTWMDDPSVQQIPRKKLDFLKEMFEGGKGKSQKEMMAYMIPMMKKAQQEKLTFSKEELTLAINAIKRHSTREELDKIIHILSRAGQNN